MRVLIAAGEGLPQHVGELCEPQRFKFASPLCRPAVGRQQNESCVCPIDVGAIIRTLAVALWRVDFVLNNEIEARGFDDNVEATVRKWHFRLDAGPLQSSTLLMEWMTVDGQP